MKRTLLNKKIPSYIGFLGLLLLIPLISWFVENNSFVRIKANPNYSPRDIQISNVTDSSFTVSFITTEATPSTISYGEKNDLKDIAFDIRDTTQSKPAAHKAHFFTVNNLRTNTEYSFTILAGNMVFKKDGQPYTVTTGSVLTTIPKESKKITGHVILPDGTYPTETIVYVISNTSQQLAKLTELDGSFSIERSLLRTSTFDGYADLPESEELQLRVVNSDHETSVNVLVKNAGVVPTITLSKNYDFTYDTAPDEGHNTTDTANLFPEYSTNKILSKTPQILIPTENQAFDDLQPEFSGTALPSKTIDISFDTSPIKSTVRANATGSWYYRPKLPMEPGNHTIIVSTKDDSGMLVTSSQTFAIHAIGSQFFAPSPAVSPTLTPTVKPSISPTIQPTVTVQPTVPTGGPTLSPVLTPTITPSLLPSPTPIAVITVTIPPTTPLPSVTPPGSGTVAVTFGFALFAIVVGIMVFFLTHV